MSVTAQPLEGMITNEDTAAAAVATMQQCEVSVAILAQKHDYKWCDKKQTAQGCMVCQALGHEYRNVVVPGKTTSGITHSLPSVTTTTTSLFPQS
jgi:hypothetical protein